MITDRKEASQRHIVTAIATFHDGCLDCAITLAAAAEGILPKTSDPHLWQKLREAAPDIDVNAVSNWLKHPLEPDAIEIDQFESVIMITRAITKFVAVYHQSCEPFESFLTWAVSAGFPVIGKKPISN